MIGIELKKFQSRCVDYLFERTTSSLNYPKLLVESPTGSGKTIILIAYIEKYLSYYPETIFCWFTPGKGDLEEQSKEKMERYSHSSKTGTIHDILNIGFENGTTYFINWEMVTDKTNRAIRDSERKNLFNRIADSQRNNQNIVVIIDEEHQNNTSKANDIISAINSKYEIRVSATPNKMKNCEYYQIREADVINEELITKYLLINDDFGDISIDGIESETDILIEKADETRKKILKAYEEENEDVKPLVLIQFPNLNDKLIEYVEEKLKSMGYTYDNKMVASWFSAETKQDKEKNSKKLGKINIGDIKGEDSITKNNAAPCFLLFKQALATGWDCPRAKILVKLRENMSEQFEIQTLGRLRRTPKAKHYGKEILDCSYLYTFDEKYKEEVIGNKGAYETQRVFLKEEPKTIKLKKELRNKDGNFLDEKLMRDKLYEFFKEKYNLSNIKLDNKNILENYGYIFGTKIKYKYLTGKYIETKDLITSSNYETLEIEVNTHTHGNEKQQRIDYLKKILDLSYDKTNALLRTYFLRGVGVEKYKILNLSMREFTAFIINNVDKLKEDFRGFEGIKVKQTQILINKVEDFSIPLEEHYRFLPYEKYVKNLEKNVYERYNTSMIVDGIRSMSERLFEKHCEMSGNVKFVYKNGDSGRNYLSIVYGTFFEKQRLFYPDYIVQLNDGSIWLIETKGGENEYGSKNIDIQVENKFEAFKNFANRYNYNFAFVRDKNNDLYYCNTEYTDDMNSDFWKPLEELF
ncbi:DEAD/DEAH box helicase family protein [uncultured Fusobacterium sp.]|jgi:type III restriction enzyme|uniref:DEAD/DEAH box helicase n=1 Tax=uncultured Fusobacterium sp. TaxID=159267 RepID=UPI0025EAF63A|nr:DEAD/DEAH box helicase family protein [uncultured Fusobacterium sp.]